MGKEEKKAIEHIEEWLKANFKKGEKVAISSSEHVLIVRRAEYYFAYTIAD